MNCIYFPLYLIVTLLGQYYFTRMYWRVRGLVLLSPGLLIGCEPYSLFLDKTYTPAYTPED